MDYTAFGQQIRRIRKQRRLTQEQLAEQIDMSASFLGHIERGTRVASIDTLMKLCAVLAVTPNDLLGDELLAQAAELPETVSISPRQLLSTVAAWLRAQENP